MLIDHVNKLRREGMDRSEALLVGGRDRLRPILMTAGATMLALLPMAVGRTGLDGLYYFPLARAVIGGLAASTVLTLVILPFFYTLLDDLAAAGAPGVAAERGEDGPGGAGDGPSDGPVTPGNDGRAGRLPPFRDRRCSHRHRPPQAGECGAASGTQAARPARFFCTERSRPPPCRTGRCRTGDSVPAVVTGRDPSGCPSESK